MKPSLVSRLADYRRGVRNELGGRPEDLEVDPNAVPEFEGALPCSHCGQDCRGRFDGCGAMCPECGRFTVYRYWFPRVSVFGGLFDRRRGWVSRIIKRAHFQLCGRW